MATISNLVDQLKIQNDISNDQTEVLDSVKTSIDGLSTNLQSFISLSERRSETEALREREAQIEKSSKSSGGGSSGFLNSLGAGGAFGLGALGVGSLAGLLLSRVLPVALMNAIGNQLAEYVETETGSKELGEAVYRALGFSSLGGLLFGKKGFLAGGIFGALLTDATKTEIDRFLEISEKNIEEAALSLGLNLDDLNLSLSALFDRITLAISNTIRNINNTIDDDPNTVAGDDWIEDALIASGLAFLFKRPRRLVGAGVKKAYEAGKGLFSRKPGVGTVLKPDAETEQKPGVGTVLKPNAPVVPPAAMITPQSIIGQTSNLSKQQLDALTQQGYMVNKAGRIVTSKGNFIPKADEQKLLDELRLLDNVKKAPGKIPPLLSATKTAGKFAGRAVMGPLGWAWLGYEILDSIGLMPEFTSSDRLNAEIGTPSKKAAPENIAVDIYLRDKFPEIQDPEIPEFPEINEKYRDLVKPPWADVPVENQTNEQLWENMRRGRLMMEYIEEEREKQRRITQDPNLSSFVPETNIQLSELTAAMSTLSSKSAPIIIQDSSTKIGGSTTNQGIVMRSSAFDQYDPYLGTRTV